MKYRLEVIERRLQTGIQTRTCIVSSDNSTIVPFTMDKVAAHKCKTLNAGASHLRNYFLWPVEDCFFVSTGEPVRPKALDGPENVVVNVMGIDYSVPKPVADYLATVKQGFTDACIKIADLEQQDRRCTICRR